MERVIIKSQLGIDYEEALFDIYSNKEEIINNIKFEELIDNKTEIYHRIGSYDEGEVIVKFEMNIKRIKLEGEIKL